MEALIYSRPLIFISNKNSGKRLIVFNVAKIRDIVQMIKVYGALVDDVYFENEGSHMADVIIELLDLDIEKK